MTAAWHSRSGPAASARPDRRSSLPSSVRLVAHPDDRAFVDAPRRAPRRRSHRRRVDALVAGGPPHRPRERGCQRAAPAPAHRCRRPHAQPRRRRSSCGSAARSPCSTCFDIDAAFFLSGAGFIGAALAIGGQHKVNDYLTGLSVLIEDRYGVGDELIVDVVRRRRDPRRRRSRRARHHPARATSTARSTCPTPRGRGPQPEPGGGAATVRVRVDGDDADARARDAQCRGAAQAGRLGAADRRRLRRRARRDGRPTRAGSTSPSRRLRPLDDRSRSMLVGAPNAGSMSEGAVTEGQMPARRVSGVTLVRAAAGAAARRRRITAAPPRRARPRCRSPGSCPGRTRGTRSLTVHSPQTCLPGRSGRAPMPVVPTGKNSSGSVSRHSA